MALRKSRAQSILWNVESPSRRPGVGRPRPKPLKRSLDVISRRLRRARRLWIATDFDGTLTPIVRHPKTARLPARARGALSRLARLPGVEVAVLSGRSLADLRRQVRLRKLFLAGSSGLETQAPGEAPHRHVATGALSPQLRAAARAWCDRFEGAWLEDKGVALSLHYRRVVPRLQPAFRA